MQKFKLEILFHIIGIGSASGIFYKDSSVFLISDNGGYLYEYNTTTNTVGKIAIADYEVSENIPKKLKPDFEAMASYGDSLYIFGSGSTENRNKMTVVDLKTQTVTMSSIADLYGAMQSFSGIKPEDFNIEGVVYNGKEWYFFQRGNGKSGKSGVYTVSGENLANSFSILYNEIKLPKIKGVRASFTDAVFVGNDIYFLACAEDSQSTYEDGAVMGSLIGKLDINKMKITATQVITNDIKFEGIAILEQKDKLSFLLCEDNDTETLESNIYKLEIEAL